MAVLKLSALTAVTTSDAPAVWDEQGRDSRHGTVGVIGGGGGGGGGGCGCGGGGGGDDDGDDDDGDEW